ncbi:hypothetical protein [Neolewinella agarilytica]|uniref:Outer membrane protein beta-barrel domain-containing protein n=1 Tax=Neolewinella agarilytica TaxID=478744 RepID=A0A1H9NIY3_9BACT|nr:hypothetical protein [Neolewinella agarilytica]SER35862.1 hypothetical protein SAMN05444359_13725 [Neolewinella agarilytica]
MNQQNQDFDDLIRKRLGESVPPEKPVDGWERLSEKMDADTDIQLRAALSGLSIGQHATGWEHLEQKLDPLAIADKQLADKLTGLEPAAPAGSWEKLSARIDDEVGQEVDAVLVSQLSRELAGAPSGWAALAARLELIGQRRSMVAAWKITEVSLLLSLLLLFVRFGPERVLPAPVLAEEYVSFPIADVQVEETKATPEVAVSTAVTAINDIARTGTPDGKTRQTRPRTGLAARRTPALVLPMPAAFAGEEEQTSAPVAVSQDNEQSAKVDPVASVEGLDIRPLSRSLSLPSPAVQLPRVDHSEPVRYYANVYSSPFDFNQVVTPANAVREIDISGDDRITRGMSFGLLMDISQGKNGLQIGAIFGRRSYIPTALKWYLEESYPLIEPVKGYSRFIYETISFPLSYQRTFTESDKWRFSGRVGMNMTVIARSSFSIPTEDQELLIDAFNGRADLPGPPPAVAGEEASGGRSVTTSGSSSRKLVNPDPGWLEGGSMLANSSFYLGGGLQVERLITPRWSIYVSPSFGRVIYLREKQGIGPYNDRIHTGSIRFGGRYLLSRK